jgi:alginate O-acetyltransferase complex protein AlgI
MVFTTQLFLFYFLPAVLLTYHALPLFLRALGLGEERVTVARNALLLAASYLFYGWWEPWFILLLLFVTAVNHACGLLIRRPAASARQRFWILAATVFLSLGTLGFFKYLVFFQMNLNHLLGWLGADGVSVLKVALPVGVSFYTFKALSYSIDVYRGSSPPARSYLDFACFVALFPQLLEGPISRYNALAGQLVRRSHTWERFSSGVAIFVLGFAKKILLADPVGEVADAAFEAQALTAGQAWLGAAAYAFQVYFDFSGYSDMAVGLGRMFGLEIMKNFDSPYLAESITDFWRRWHISLSSFLRDYLYIPLGGNRKGLRRTYVNLMAVMLLGGLWHGASWTFVAWGGYHGALLVLERYLGKQSLYQRLPRFLRIGATFILVLLSWVLFRSQNFEQALAYLGSMLGWGAADPGALLVGARMYTRGALAGMLACAVCAFSTRQAHDWAESVTWPKALALAPIFCLTLMAMFAQSFSPFIYFKF